jgi:adenosylhomocysteine nucleosidase
MSNKPIGIIGAMQIEIDGLKAAMTDITQEVISGVTFTRGKLCGREVVCAVCGVGKVFAAIAAQTMILRFDPCALLNTGVAGGLATGLRVGDIVLADSVVQHDMDTSPLGDPVGLLSGINVVNIKTDETLLQALISATRRIGIEPVVGTVASGDQFIAADAQKDRIRRLFDAAACEMEGASIGHVAYVNNIPFAVLRAISDGGDGMEFSKFVDLAATRSIAATKEFVQLI